MGTASGGGSARTTSVSLLNRIGVRIGSMASFQIDGRLFDGNGVEPNVVVEPNPEFFIGGNDNQLRKASRFIKGK